VERYTEDQARNYLYLLDKAIDVDCTITNELRQVRAGVLPHFMQGDLQEPCQRQGSRWLVSAGFEDGVPCVNNGEVHTSILAVLEEQFADRPPLLDVPVAGCV
jgi:hypothetical protein